MKAKLITVQAKIAGEVIFDKTVSGKAKQTALLRECMEAIDTRGGTAIIRTQEAGAKSWARYSYTAGEKAAYPDRNLVWDEPAAAA